MMIESIFYRKLLFAVGAGKAQVKMDGAVNFKQFQTSESNAASFTDLRLSEVNVFLMRAVKINEFSRLFNFYRFKNSPQVDFREKLHVAFVALEVS